MVRSSAKHKLGLIKLGSPRFEDSCSGRCAHRICKSLRTACSHRKASLACNYYVVGQQENWFIYWAQGRVTEEVADLAEAQKIVLCNWNEHEPRLLEFRRSSDTQ